MRANGMHALRHTYASVLLEDGVSIKALAEYLGHADPGFTLRTYTHLMPSSEDPARTAVVSRVISEYDYRYSGLEATLNTAVEWAERTFAGLGRAYRSTYPWRDVERQAEGEAGSQVPVVWP